MLHIWELLVGTNHRRVWRDLGMPTRKNKAVSIFWMPPFHGKSSKSDQDLSTRVRPSEAKQEWGGRDTKEALGGEGRSFGISRRVDLVHWYISTVGVWCRTLSKCKRASGFSGDWRFSCLSPQQGKPGHCCFGRCLWHIRPEVRKEKCENLLLYTRFLCMAGLPHFFSFPFASKVSNSIPHVF